MKNLELQLSNEESNKGHSDFELENEQKGDQTVVLLEDAAETVKITNSFLKILKGKRIREGGKKF